MEEKVLGITLRSVNYKESDRILTVFTLEKGKISVSARGVRKANAKWKWVAEPFCFARSVIAEKSGRFTLKESETVDFFYPVRTDIEKYYAAYSALEFTDAFMQEEMVSPEFFYVLADFLKKLCYGEEKPKNLLIKFFDAALKLSGQQVDFSDCGRCGKEITGKVFLSPYSGCSVCENCREPSEKEYSFDTYQYIKTLLEGKDVYSGDSAKNALKFYYYYIKTACGVDIKSVSVLSEI